MRAHVLHSDAGGAGEPDERAHLVERVAVDLLVGHLHRAASEAVAVREGRVSADRDAVLPAQRHRATHDLGIAGVEAACHVGRAQRREQSGVVVTVLPPRQALTEVGGKVDHAAHGATFSRRPCTVKRVPRCFVSEV